ncbi:ran GTPase activating protein 1 [Panus rudis PR-1116 ss-1]|nr:ran GTPase activating protein 1 [Panus rudis PR-1116 ss-1]
MVATASRVVSVAGLNLTLDTRADIEPHLANIDVNVTEELHFNGNTIGIEAARALGERIQDMKALKVANLSDIFTRRDIDEIPPALESICGALAKIATLEEVNLSDNAFGVRSVQPLVPLLHNRSIRVLKLNNNGLGPEAGKIVANALLESANLSRAAGEQSNLRIVICGKNRLEDGSAAAWAEAFAAHGNLTKVWLEQNGIRQKGFTTIIRGLAKCTHLRYLNLRDNVGWEADEESDDTDVDAKHGWHALAEALSHWKELRHLNVSDCFVRPMGLQLLLDAFNHGYQSKLHTLLLDNDELGETGYAKLSSVVTESLPSLTRLSLLWNDCLDDDEIAGLAEKIEGRGGQLILEDDDELAENWDDNADYIGEDIEAEISGTAAGPLRQKPMTIWSERWLHCTFLMSNRFIGGSRISTVLVCERNFPMNSRDA